MTTLIGLSNAAKFGIGFGIPIGVFLAAALAFGYFCLQRWKRQQQNDAAEYSPCDQELDGQNDESGKRQNQAMSLSSWASMAMDSWYYETIALCFSIACFIATICVLKVYNQQSTPQFSYGLTLNTVISVLATASKSSLIFVVSECIGELKWVWFRDVLKPLSNLQAYDSASRGPWGSILILLQDKGRSLVSIGALITVLALTYDPFVQQIVRYHIRETISNSEAATAKKSISLSTAFDISATGTAYVDATELAFWTNEFSFDPTCPSGNCTWPTFHSTELCSRCEDVTSHSTLVGCDPGSFNASLSEDMQISCNVSLPQGAWSSDPITITVFQEHFRMVVPQDIIWDVNHVNSRDSNASYFGIENPLWVVAHAALTVPNSWVGYTWVPTEKIQIHRVTECAMFFCARKYNISVSDGNPMTDILAENSGTYFFNEVSRQNCWGAKDMTPFDPSGDLETQDIPAGIVFCSPINFNLPDLPGNSTLTFGIQKGTPPSASDGPSQSISSTKIKKILDVGLEKVIQNMALSVSKFFRDNSNETVQGTATVSESYVVVSWPWLALPATLLALGAVLLVSTFSVDKHHKLNPWKTSSLPVLYHSLDDNLIPENREYGSASQMEQIAGETQVRLGPSGIQSRLVFRQ